MTEADFASTTVKPEKAVTPEFDKLVRRLTPQADKNVERVDQIAVGLTVAANHLAAKAQRVEPKK
ncbi:MAG: hypothetical protein Q7R31_00600 [Candidatus Levybacteria bacterium]|nr:hypothetical protein [Candidatus Levybacteria bacterium]